MKCRANFLLGLGAGLLIGGLLAWVQLFWTRDLIYSWLVQERNPNQVMVYHQRYRLGHGEQWMIHFAGKAAADQCEICHGVEVL